MIYNFKKSRWSDQLWRTWRYDQLKKWCQSYLTWNENTDIRPKLDKSNTMKSVQAYWHWSIYWWSCTWVGFSLTKQTWARIEIIDKTNLSEGWDQDLLPKPKITEQQSLFTSDVNEYYSVPRIEHWCTWVAVATLPPVVSATVIGFEIWQLTCNQFDSDSLDNSLLYQNWGIHNSWSSSLTWTKHSQE